MTQRILIVDDDHYTRKLLEGLFRDKPQHVDMAENAAVARHRLKHQDYNLILMDQRLPDGNGLDLLREIRAERPRQIAVLITGHADVRDAVRAVREGLFDYLAKPFEDLEELEAVIEKALVLDAAYREINSLRETLTGKSQAPPHIGNSPAAKMLQTKIAQIAPLDVTVLVEGESGTGKELAARMVYALSQRSKSRFLEVNCGALSEQLLESTLFGYEKGAFTGAVKTTPGCFEAADGGTLFLDEIADMSTKLQSSLLRVLQEHTFSRLGSSNQLSSDFRLICATNRCLEEEVRAGNFREDLFYRINVVALEIPPLRERVEDIVPLAVHFLQHFNDRFNKQVGPLTPDAISVVEQFSWPGNVRQLKHTFERIVALHAGGPVSAIDLGHLAATGSTDSESAEEESHLSFQGAREVFERRYLKKVLARTQGNISEAARQCGISRQNLYIHLKRLGLS